MQKEVKVSAPSKVAMNRRETPYGRRRKLENLCDPKVKNILFLKMESLAKKGLRRI